MNAQTDNRRFHQKPEMGDLNNGQRNPQECRFLILPLELRLKIYANCNAVSLLVLTHTCRALYIDINTQSKVVQSAIGGSKPFSRYIKHVYKPPTDLNPHPMLLKSAIPLTIPMMEITELEEPSAFNRVYGLSYEQWLKRSGSDHPDSQQQPFRFLALPFKVRVRIYLECDPISLLILTHSCYDLYSEINTRSQLVEYAKAYFNPPESWWSTWSYEGPVPVPEWRTCPELPEGVNQLTVPLFEEIHIFHLYWISELDQTVMSTFNRVYGLDPHHRESDPSLNGWWMCERCKTIRRTSNFSSSTLCRHCSEQYYDSD
ncbi:hypothetical protein BJ508DRAFT_333544 [Ascobolus immersus RN42]|uniref:F-box domain-containing protein n=1 Tax=Ascobolus immersus RN42 TaxID=1160509 RepID=A0A3N4HL38_ASCIM|nr:hypothetical protein BJ508DRAFT_333544 [Ascobolus immersus RN42]